MRSNYGPICNRQRYFMIAEGSAYELAVIFDVADTFGVLSDARHAAGLDICDHLGAMLSRYR